MLIKSLSGRERANFAQYCNEYGKSDNFLPLFQTIESQNDYDEEKIRAEFEGEKFLNNLSQTKKNLFKAILRSLRIIGTSKNESIYNLFEDCLQLYNRGILDQAGKLLKRIKVVSKSTEEFHICEKCIDLQRKIALKSVEFDLFLKINTELNHEEAEVEAMKKELRDLASIRNQSLLPVKKKLQARGKLEQRNIEDLLTGLPGSENELSSIRAQKEYLSIFANVYSYQRQVEKCYSANYSLVSLFQAHSFLRADFFEEFADRQAFVSALALELGKSEDAVGILGEMKENLPEIPYQKRLVQDRIHLLSLYMENDLEEGFLSDDELTEIESFVHSENISDLRKIQYFFWLSVIHLNKMNFEKSQALSRELILRNWGEVLIDFQSMGRIIHLLAIFAIGDSDLLEVYHRPASRFLKKNLQMRNFEKIVLKFVKKEIGFFPESLEKLEKQLTSKVEEGDLRYTQHYFDVLNWIRECRKAL